MKDKLLTALKGLIVGGTMLVPGVSGGSMAIILGIYDRLVNAVSGFMKHKRKSLIFLALFALGGALGMVLFAKPLLKLIDAYPKPTIYFFLGAVAGSVPMVYKQAQVKKFSWRVPLYILIGLLVVFGISLLPKDLFVQSQMNISVVSLLLLVLAGFIAAVSLVLPGISVSYLLLLMGLYDETMRAISQLYLPFLIPFGIGLLLGIILTTKLLEQAMNRHPLPTYMIILGFVMGSMVQVFPGLPTLQQLPICLLTLVTGFVIIRLLARQEARSDISST